MENDKKTSNEIQVELSEEMAQGTYANYPRGSGRSESTGEKPCHPDSG